MRFLPCLRHWAWMGPAMGLLLLSGCSDKDNAAVAPAADAQSAVPEQATLALAALAPAADSQPNRDSLTFTRSEEGRLLTQGWQGINYNQKKDVSWFGDCGIIDLVLPQPEGLDISMRLTPSNAVEKLPKQTVRVLWNDHDLGTFPVKPGGSVIKFRVPVKVQRYGANRLKLLAGYWFSTSRVGLKGEDRILSMACSDFSIRRNRPTIPQSRPAASVSGTDILLPADSAICFDMLLPENPTLSLNAEIENSATVTGKAEAVVALTDTSGEQKVLIKKELQDGQEELALETSLSDFSGRHVSLSLSFPFTPAANDVISTATLPQLRFKNPQVAFTRMQPAAQDLSDKRAGYNVILVVFDALRADYIEPYGDPITKTPAMSALAAGGVTFANATSSASWTRCSAASYLTSLRPPAHQVLEEEDMLSSGVPLLPEVMKELGYRTLSVVNNAQVSPTFGFGRGFDQVKEIFGNRPSQSADPAAQFDTIWKSNVDPFLASDRGKPFFIYLHEIDPHAPYVPPAPFNNLYGDFSWLNIDQTKAFSNLVAQGAMGLTPEQINGLQSLYRGEITYMDGYLQALMNRLREQELDRETLLVFFSDHGEEIMDHNAMRHGATLYEEVTRVPLILSLPGVLPAGKRIEGAAELIDIAPTILDLIDEQIPESMQGRSLLPKMFSPVAPDEREPAFATLGRPALDAVWQGPWKLIRRSRPENDLETYMLFNLKDDPGEKNNLWAREPVVGRSLRQLLALQDRENEKARTAGPVKIERKQLDPVIRRDLEALGYL